jgi:F0F1-type ATP synthase gamma subunit
MPRLQSLHRKIAAFEDTQKITNAMKMVAGRQYGARMAAMDCATWNTGQLISKVTLQHNKAYQTAITIELMDIAVVQRHSNKINVQC